MITSESLNELAPALAKAQSKIEGASKDAANSHFKSRYADLASVWDACRKPLTDNGLSVVQTLSSEGDLIKCTSMLLHSSGQFIKSEFGLMPMQKGPQAAGSCATYLRRYSLQALVGVAPDDDDGNAASAIATSKPMATAVRAPAPSGFDPTNAAHLAGIKAELAKRSIDKDQHVDVVNAMVGKPLSELDSVIKNLSVKGK
jgi:hypothetical protein